MQTDSGYDKLPGQEDRGRKPFSVSGSVRSQVTVQPGGGASIK